MKKAYDEFYPGRFTVKNIQFYFQNVTKDSINYILRNLVKEGYLERERESYHEPYQYQFTEKGVHYIESGMWKKARDRFKRRLSKSKERVIHDYKENV